MGQKVNPNIYNFLEKSCNQSKYFEKKWAEHCVYSKIDLDFKKFMDSFFGVNQMLINNSNVLYFSNMLHIYIAYYQKINYDILKASQNKQTKRVTNLCLDLQKLTPSIWKKIAFKKSFSKCRISIKKKWNSTWESKISKNFEIFLFLENFFSVLTKFIPRKYKILLTLERQNTQIFVINNLNVIVQRKQKLLSLRKYKQNIFFKYGVNVFFTSLKNKNPSKLIAQFIAIQIKVLKHHHFFIRFLKNALVILKSNIFLSTVRGIKIQIKGRFNSRPRAQSQLIQIAKKPPVLTKNLNINYFEQTSFTLNGTFGIKIWVYQI